MVEIELILELYDGWMDTSTSGRVILKDREGWGFPLCGGVCQIYAGLFWDGWQCGWDCGSELEVRPITVAL